MASGLVVLLAAAPPRVVGQAPPLSAEEQAVLEYINAYRAENGLNPLTVSAKSTEAARWMSQDMAAKDYFSHTDSLGRSPFERMAAAGYDCVAYNTWCGENLAAGVAAGSETFQLWRDSPAHNANMLNPNYVVAGVAAAFNQDSTFGWYWTLDLGGFDDSGQAPPIGTPEPTPTALPPTPTPPTPTPPPPTETPPPADTPVPPPADTPVPPPADTPVPPPADTPVPPPTITAPPAATETPPPEPAETVAPLETPTPSATPASQPSAESSGRQLGQAPPTRTDEVRSADAPLLRELKPGWNRVEVGGQPADVTELFPLEDGYLLAVYAWDQGSGAWLRYLPGVGIPGVNTLTELPGSQIVWVLTTREMVLRLPA